MSKQGADRLQLTLEHVFDQVKEWSVIWGYSLLPKTLNIEFMSPDEPDMGRCHFASDTIFLNGQLLQEGKEALFTETLCHECAHWMAFRRYGLGIEPHGPEWQGYMRQAGFEPRTCFHGDTPKGRS
jgi:hypothetical protein